MLVQRKWYAGAKINSGIFRIPNPAGAQSLQLFTVAGTTPVLSGEDTAQQTLTGDFLGEIDLSAGVVFFYTNPGNLFFAPENLRVNGVTEIIIPTDAALLGLDTTRLPMTGRVPILRKGGIVLLHSTKTDSLATPQAGATVQLSRTSLAWAKVKDANGVLVPTAAYSVVLSTGALTWANPLDLGDTQSPYVCEHRIQDLATLVDAQLNGNIQLNLPTTHDYDAADTFVSSAIPTGTLQARTQDVSSYQSWSGSFENLGTTEQTLYDNVLYPITVRNDGSVEDDWVLKFNTSNQFVAIGKQRGQLPDVGTVAVDFSPINPLTGLPFFTVDASGWRGGIIPGNFVYFRVRAASCPIWIIRATMPNADPPAADSITIEMIGDVMP